jgi:hypothetical protein
VSSDGYVLHSYLMGEFLTRHVTSRAIAKIIRLIILSSVCKILRFVPDPASVIVLISSAEYSNKIISVDRNHSSTISRAL